jgi:glycosyltransferase involved in cell wall biosynthesis
MPHWIDEEIFTDVPDSERRLVREQRGGKGETIALFAGNLGLVQGLDTVVRAGALLRADEHIRIVLVGDGADRARLEAIVAELGAGDRVQLLERQPMTEMPRIMAAADVLLVHLRRSELSRFIIPTKTLAYLAAGKPILMAMEGAAADLVEEAGAGTIIPPDDPEALANALRSMAAASAEQRIAWGEAGKRYLRTTLTKSHVIPQYEEALRRVAEAR